MLRNWRRKNSVSTVGVCIGGWDTPSANDTSCYIRRVCTEMQVPDSYVPDVNDIATMCACAAAISLVENGVPAVMADVHAGWDLL